MKVVCLHGSPRKNGNSSTIANRFCSSAEEVGAKVTHYELNDLNYKGCQACYACKKGSEKCVVKDDLEKVLDDVASADILVLATPIFYGDVTAQMKGFIDRTFSYFVPDFLTNSNKSRLGQGRKIDFCIVQAQPNEKKFEEIYPKYSQFFKWAGFTESYLIRTCGVGDISDTEKRDDVLNKAKELANRLV